MFYAGAVPDTPKKYLFIILLKIMNAKKIRAAESRYMDDTGGPQCTGIIFRL